MKTRVTYIMGRMFINGYYLYSNLSATNICMSLIMRWHMQVLFLSLSPMINLLWRYQMPEIINAACMYWIIN